jgi:subtilisin-like proprotein convertase family protein
VEVIMKTRKRRGRRRTTHDKPKDLAVKKSAKVKGGQRKATGNWTLTVQDKAAD